MQARKFTWLRDTYFRSQNWSIASSSLLFRSVAASTARTVMKRIIILFSSVHKKLPSR